MLNSRLTIERADNGWVASWYDGAPTFTPHREVFSEPVAFFNRLSELMGILGGAAAARALLAAAELSCHVDPATDPDAAAIAAPGTPPTVPIGD